MVEKIEFRFRYAPDTSIHELDAYDASQVLYGAARSLAIVTHYAIAERVIKQAPSLHGARILLTPPKIGSFEFELFAALDPELIKAVAANAAGTLVAGAVLAKLAWTRKVVPDLFGMLLRRATGKPDRPATDEVKEIERRRPGDVAALSEAIEEDIPRIHRPVIRQNIYNFNVYGDGNIIGTFDRDTYEYASARELGKSGQEFVGNVASFNANTVSGRFWVISEERTIGFRVDQTTKLERDQKRLLAWSLSEYTSGRDGRLVLAGTPLLSKAGSVKNIFITDVRRA